MSNEIKVVENLNSIQKHGLFEGILLAPVRFEDDPVTGFFFKCPECRKVSVFQFSSISEREIVCNDENCKISVDIEKIKGKIIS